MNKKDARVRRARKTRARIAEQRANRLVVSRSNCHIYAQIVDDASVVTLAAASSCDDVKAMQSAEAGKGKFATSHAVGKLLAQRAKDKGVTAVAFDRGGYLYHGRVKALADGARAGGLNF